MKSLFKNNVKTIAAMALATVVTISMSFTAPQTIDLKANEINSIGKENNLSKILAYAAPRFTIAVMTREYARTATRGGKTNDQIYGSSNEMVQLKLSQLDQQ